MSKTQQNARPAPMKAAPPGGKLHNFSANAVPPVVSGKVRLDESANCVPPVGPGKPSTPPPGSPRRG